MGKYVSGFGPGNPKVKLAPVNLSGSPEIKPVRVRKRLGDSGGISFQVPPGWDDGSGKIRHVESGPLKGRVYFKNRREAVELAKRLEGKTGDRTRFDPN